MAKEVIGAELSEKPETVTNRVLRAVKELERERFIELQLNPEDAPLIKDKLQILKEKCIEANNFRLVQNAQITRGDSLLVLDGYEVHASVEDHFLAISEFVKERMETCLS